MSPPLPFAGAALALIGLLMSGCHLIFPFDRDERLPADRGPGPDLRGDGAARDAAADGGGWRLVTRLDPATQGCPSPWVYVATSAGCAMSQPGCSGKAAPIKLQPLGPYSEVRGYLRGVQYKSTDAFSASKPSATIDDYYVDGVSVTVGSPRQHLWTYAAGLYRTTPGPTSCPCLGGAKPPLFVGTSYTCDSGNPDSWYDEVWYTALPLWDADSAGPGCKSPPAPGWFEAQLGAATTAPIEVRIILDGCDENLAITALELLVR